VVVNSLDAVIDAVVTDYPERCYGPMLIDEITRWSCATCCPNPSPSIARRSAAQGHHAFSTRQDAHLQDADNHAFSLTSHFAGT